MSSFAIVEVENGFEVVEYLPDQMPEDAAAIAGGQLVDPGPYDSYQAAKDALDQLDILDDRE